MLPRAVSNLCLLLRVSRNTSLYYHKREENLLIDNAYLKEKFESDVINIEGEVDCPD
jgi:hypothetical protein